MIRRLVIFILLMAGFCAKADDFLIRVALKGAQVAEVQFGCSKAATDGYDSRLDIFAPPMGMGTGIVGIENPAKDLPSFYKDVRSEKLPQTWRLKCEPYQRDKPVRLTWEKKALPPGIRLTLQAGKQVIDMGAQSEFTVKKKMVVCFVAERLAEARPAVP